MAHTHAQSHFWAVKTDPSHPCYWFRRAAFSMTKNEKLKANRASETEEQRKERLRIEDIRRENKKIENHEKQRLATLKRLKEVKLREPKTGGGGR